jgi:hypothetical protein
MKLAKCQQDFCIQKNHLTEDFRRRINTGELMDKRTVSGTTPITVPHQLVVPQGLLCALYCGFCFT